MARVGFRCEDELVDRIDEARGDVPRERWLRRLVTDHLRGVEPLALTEEEVQREIADPATHFDEVDRVAPLSRAEAFRRATQRGEKR